jgi:hypothetical protein
MKKNLLLMMLCCPAMLAAQNGVTVSNLSADAGTVTFNVSWTNIGMPTPWSDTVWVFVDYNNAGKMERLPVTGATASAGTVTKIPGNDKGVWVAGNARSTGSFSATVRLFTTVSSVGGACAYASNYPPVGEYSSSDASKMVFTGTPEYDVALLHESGSLSSQTTDSPLNIPASYTVQSFTDKTAAPGKLACIPSTVYDLTASASSFCTGGAGVTFALSGTESGRIYRLYKDGTTVMSTLTGDGNAATFCEAVNEAGTYTARAAALPEYCPAVMNGSFPVASVLSPAPPTMSGSSSYCTSGTITATVGNGGNGIWWDDGTTNALRTVTASGTYHAVSTSAAGCESGTASVVVTIRHAGTDGQATDDVCGCASELSDCAGTCLASCSNFFRCGLTEMSSLPYDAYTTLQGARGACESKGMRVPEIWHMYCAVYSGLPLPGGVIDAPYWSDTGASSNPLSHYTWNYVGHHYGESATSAQNYVKCVK